MNNRDMFALSLKNLLRRKTRTLLAILGVVIGICAIITMLSIGFGLQTTFENSLEDMGSLHIINIYESTAAGSAGKKPKLSETALYDISRMQGVVAVTPTVTVMLTFADGKDISRDVSVLGVKPEVFAQLGYELQDGRSLQTGDKYSVVFGNEVANNFHRSRPILGGFTGEEDKLSPADLLEDKLIATANAEYGQPQRQMPDPETKVDYKTYKVKGVGILANPNDFNTSYNAFMPLDTVKKIQEENARAEKKRYNRNAPYTQAIAYVDEIENVLSLAENLRAIGFQTSSMSDYLKEMQKQSRMIQTVLGSIGAVSLLVAALGITNTMIMSIYERTKEIGIMKVIGANLPDIRKMFLIEAALIGFGGGLIGVILSCLFSYIANTFLAPLFGQSGPISLIPLWLPLAALAFASAVGVLAGYSPARRAMNLSALESLRNE